MHGSPCIRSSHAVCAASSIHAYATVLDDGSSGGLNFGPSTSTPPPLTMPFWRLVSSTTSTSPSASSLDVSALYLKKQKVPSARLFALDAIFVYASQKSWRFLCAPMDLDCSLSLSRVAARSALAMPALSTSTRSSMFARRPGE